MAAPIAQKAAKQLPKQVSFWSNLFKDTGNIPLIMANSAGASLIVIFGGRKLLTHPDISVSDELRFSNEVQNETATRQEQAEVFRNQTRLFGSILKPLNAPIMSLATGTPQGLYTPGDKSTPYDKWSLDFLINTEITTPLESTDAFDDGLYTGIKATPYAFNEENGRV